jgi:serine phosphatase RsbU (regulator of sigma subunit)
LVLYSDGVTDAQNAGAEFFGEERLHATICAHKGDPASQLQEAILAAVHQFTGDTSRFDDITVLVLERQPPASSRSTPIA